MSNQPLPATPPPAGPPTGPPPVVRLPTWVNVVLILILLASCGGASNDFTGPSSDEIADTVVERLSGQEATGQVDGLTNGDTLDACRLLGAVLDGQNRKVGDVFDPTDNPSQCQQAAEVGAAR